MKIKLIISAAASVPGIAWAHPGHLVEAAGHNHWIGLAAAGVAVAIGLWAGLKGKAQSEETEIDEESEEEAAA